MTYKPGDQPDPDFVKFFAGDWQRMLEAVEVPGMEKPSWDRRAAYLLYTYGLPYDDTQRTCGYMEDPAFPWKAPPVRHAFDAPSARGQSTVGRVDFALTMLDNHFGIDDCKPTPGGVKLAFDSSKHKW